MTPEQAQFLREHRLAVLGTGRRDGSPQLSTVLYDYDGADIVISVRQRSAKWLNACRQPRVALAVLDGRRQLICYGLARAEASGAGRIEGMRRIRAKSRRRPEERDLTDAELEATLDAEGRAILRIAPERVFFRD